MHIDMGGNGRYSMTSIGIVTFQRDSSSPLRLEDVRFVLGLNNNIVSIVVLEYHGYNVIFSKGKDFLRHITM